MSSKGMWISLENWTRSCVSTGRDFAFSPFGEKSEMSESCGKGMWGGYLTLYKLALRARACAHVPVRLHAEKPRGGGTGHLWSSQASAPIASGGRRPSAPGIRYQTGCQAENLAPVVTGLGKRLMPITVPYWGGGTFQVARHRKLN